MVKHKQCHKLPKDINVAMRKLFVAVGIQYKVVIISILYYFHNLETVNFQCHVTVMSCHHHLVKKIRIQQNCSGTIIYIGRVGLCSTTAMAV